MDTERLSEPSFGFPAFRGQRIEEATRQGDWECGLQWPVEETEGERRPEASRLCDTAKEGKISRRRGWSAMLAEVEKDGDREVTPCLSAWRALVIPTSAISVPWW